MGRGQHCLQREVETMGLKGRQEAQSVTVENHAGRKVIGVSFHQVDMHTVRPTGRLAGEGRHRQFYWLSVFASCKKWRLEPRVRMWKENVCAFG